MVLIHWLKGYYIGLNCYKDYGCHTINNQHRNIGNDERVLFENQSCVVLKMLSLI